MFVAIRQPKGNTMKILQKTLLTLLATSILSVSAQAAVSMGNGQPYVGLKAGQFQLNDSDLDEPTALGVVVGYKFTPSVGMEAEYIGSKEETVRLSGVDIDYDLKTYGLYGTYSYTFPSTDLYVKGKLGLAKTEFSAEASNFNSSSDSSESGLAGGIGLGYSVTPNIAIEGEYAFLASDVDLMTLGATYKF